MTTTEATTRSPDDRIAKLIAQGYGVRIEPCPRRLRIFVDNEVIADSKRAIYLFETKHIPVYYLPLEDILLDLLEPTSHSSHCPFKGDANYWSIVVGDRRIENAVWGYRQPIDTCPDISGYVAFYWDRVDAWFEEDEEVFVHPRDPYHRVDVLESSRHVEVYAGGVKVADSHRPRLLFETGLPTRYYLPKLDVAMHLLRPSPNSTACPYKGSASHWSMGEDAGPLADVAWSYAFPLAGMEKIANLVSFYGERVDRIVVDGEEQARPRTQWSPKG